MLQPAAQDVEAQRTAEVADVGTGLHRRSADVDRDVLGVEGHEVAQRLRLGVVEPNSHRTSLPAGHVPPFDGLRTALNRQTR